MINLTLGEILAAEPVFGKLDKFATEEKAEFDFVFTLERLIKKIQPELQDFYTEQKKLLQKFGTAETKTNENGEVVETGNYTIDPDKRDDFMKYYNKLISLDIELYNTFPFKVSDLKGVKGLTRVDIDLLGKFVEAQPAIEEEKERQPIKLDIE